MDHEIVFTDPTGRRLSLDDLKAATGTVNYAILGNWHVPPEAAREHQAGRELGTGGRSEEAKAKFRAAAAIAPAWPYPVYDLAFAFLLEGNWQEAERCYQKVDELAPEGFFTSKVALDVLRREREGMVAPGTYRLLVLIEGQGRTEEQKQNLFRILKQSEALPRAWQLILPHVEDQATRLRAIERGLSFSPDVETRGMLLLAKAQELAITGDLEAAQQICGGLALDPGATPLVRTLARVVFRETLLPATSQDSHP